jgi:hypothetical protein
MNGKNNRGGNKRHAKETGHFIFAIIIHFLQEILKTGIPIDDALLYNKRR